MKQNDGRVSGVTPYQPYLQDGKKHYLTERDSSTNYRMAYFSAFADRFPERAVAYLPEEIAEEMARIEEDDAYAEDTNVEQVEEPACKCESVSAPVIVVKKDDDKKNKKCCCKCKCKKNLAAIVIAFIAAVLFVELAALSFFSVLPNYTGFFGGVTAKEFYQFTLDIIANSKNFGMLEHAFVGTALLTALLTVVSLFVGIAAMASKKKVCGVGVLALIALVSWLACGVIIYFAIDVAKDSAAIIKFINPLKISVGVMFGYYIAAAILIIETICGFASYKRK